MINPKENNTSFSIAQIKAELFKRQIPSEYGSVIEKVRLTHFPTPFSHYLIDVFTQDEINKSDLMKIKSQPKESIKLLHAQRTTFGNEIARVVTGKDVFDLGCGEYPAVRVIAQACNARSYIGVDSSVEDKIVNSIEGDNTFQCTYIRSDILAFLSKAESNQGIVFHLSGLEPFELQEIPNEKYSDKKYVESQIKKDNQKYILRCMEEMKRLSKPGDGVLIGPVTFGFHPENFGFEFKTEDSNRKYTLYCKS